MNIVQLRVREMVESVIDRRIVFTAFRAYAKRISVKIQQGGGGWCTSFISSWSFFWQFLSLHQVFSTIYILINSDKLIRKSIIYRTVQDLYCQSVFFFRRVKSKYQMYYIVYYRAKVITISFIVQHTEAQTTWSTQVPRFFCIWRFDAFAFLPPSGALERVDSGQLTPLDHEFTFTSACQCNSAHWPAIVCTPHDCPHTKSQHAE